MDHLCFVVHTHWDREWYQPFQEMRARLVAMTDRMLPMLESGALEHFHFDGQTIVLEDYLEVRPQNARRLARLIQSGKIAVGPWYVLADGFLASGEALLRNLEIGNAIARRFGHALEVGYLPDQFGHPAQMPQILSGFGLSAAVVWRGVPREVERNCFLWEALDGAQIRTVYLPFSYGNGGDLRLESAESFVPRVREIVSREREFAGQAPILVMNGGDHSEPDPRLSARIAEADGKAGLKLEAVRLEDYIRRVATIPSPDLPVHRGELRSPSRTYLLPGVTSTRTWIKQRDFRNCALLERYAGPLAALARMSGTDEATALCDYLDLAWRTELQNHPHDSICGCSVDQVHEDMRYRFDQAAMLAEIVVRDASRALLGTSAGIGADEAVLAVFNPTFSREALVVGEAEVPEPEAQYSLVGSDGVRIPVALGRAPGKEAARCVLSFVASGLEQAGFSFYRLVKEASPISPDAGLASLVSVENEFYRLSPSVRGIEIHDLQGGASLELYFEDDGDRGDEYNYDPVPGARPLAEPAASSATFAEDGPVRKRLVLGLEFAIPEGLTPDRKARSSATALLAVELEATLYAGLRRVDFAARVDNRSRDHRLRAALRTPVGAAESLSDTAFGVVRRPLAPAEPPGTEDICPTAPHRTFTAVEDGEFAAAVTSRGIYEVETRPEADGSTLLLTLLRCVGWLSRSDLATRRGAAGPEVETPGAQEQGTHRFEFAVTTYRGGYLEADLPGRAATYAFSPRIFTTRAEAPGGRAMFLVQCDNPRVMFSTARPLPRSGGFLVRAWSVSPEPEHARFSVGSGRDARLADLAGRVLHDKRAVQRRGATLAVDLKPFTILTLRVSDGKNFPAAVKKH